MSKCWNCYIESFDADFCNNCGKIQPVLDGTDYFGFLGVKDLLNIDQDELEKRFYELSRKFHPDYYQNGSPEELRISLEKSSFLNKAYSTLKDPFDRAKYLIELLWGKKNEQDKKNVPPEILMEVMELHEMIDYMKNESDDEKRKTLMDEVDAVRGELRKKSGALKDKLILTFEKWDTVDERLDGEKLLCVEHQMLLEEINKILVVRSYLDTLLHSIENELSRENA